MWYVCQPGSDNTSAKTQKMEFQSYGNLMNLPSLPVSETTFHTQYQVTGNSLVWVALCRGSLADQALLSDCLLLIAGDNHFGIMTTGQRQQGEWANGPRLLGDATEGVSEALESCPSRNQLNKYLPPKEIQSRRE